jgi:perosamine synthetase
MPKIPVNEPVISKNALKYVTDCIKSGWISSAGIYLKEFEEKFAKFLGVKHAITTTNGTTSLHLAVASLNIKKGDEVILPDHTMISSAAAIVYTGATPVLVDVERDSWNMDINQIESKITKRTKAIMPVHIYGHSVDMDPVIALAKKYHLYIIEDAAESTGATYKGKLTGTIGDIGCFSFYANKIITTGEGGMMVTNNDKIAAHARLLKDMAHSPEKRFFHKEIGFNFRMTNLQAALGVAQLEEVKKYIQKKRWMAALYNKELSKIKGLTLPIEHNWAKNVYWMYGILVEKEFGISRDEFMKRLLQKGIDTRTFFIPMHRQPALKKLGLFKKEKYPVSDEISRRGLYLPSGLAITKKQIEMVCKVIKNISAHVQRK